jgi:hypothetical protein
LEGFENDTIQASTFSRDELKFMESISTVLVNDNECCAEVDKEVNENKNPDHRQGAVMMKQSDIKSHYSNISNFSTATSTVDNKIMTTKPFDDYTKQGASPEVQQQWWNDVNNRKGLNRQKKDRSRYAHLIDTNFDELMVPGPLTRLLNEHQKAIMKAVLLDLDKLVFDGVPLSNAFTILGSGGSGKTFW